MAFTSTQIVADILDYIQSCSGQYYSDFYVGIAQEPRERLFEEHNVPESSSCWIYRQAIDINHARSAEKDLLAKGMKGGGGGGNDDSVFVYCYQITQNTQE